MTTCRIDSCKMSIFCVQRAKISGKSLLVSISRSSAELYVPTGSVPSQLCSARRCHSSPCCKPHPRLAAEHPATSSAFNILSPGSQILCHLGGDGSPDGMSKMVGWDPALEIPSHASVEKGHVVDLSLLFDELPSTEVELCSPQPHKQQQVWLPWNLQC